MKIEIEKIWLNEKEAEEYTTLSRETLRAARTKGKLSYRKNVSKIIYHKSDLDNFIERTTDLIKSAEDRIIDLQRKKVKQSL
jgi:hypothetical protein